MISSSPTGMERYSQMLLFSGVNLKDGLPQDQSADLSYDKFLKIFEDNLGKLEGPDTPSETRTRVTSKLFELAGKRIAEKEAAFSWIYRFFHMIGQFFKGRGFQTKGERGLELVSRMEEVDKVNFEHFKEDVSGAIGQSKLDIGDLQEKINGLTEEQFKEVLNGCIFEPLLDTGEMMACSRWAFYVNLNEEKRVLFYQEMFSEKRGREDWHLLAIAHIRRVPGGDRVFLKNNIDSFIILEMVKRFQEDHKNLFSRFYFDRLAHRKVDKKFKIFLIILIEKAIKDYLEQDPPEYDKIKSLLSKKDEHAQFNISKNDLTALTEDDLDALEENGISLLSDEKSAPFSQCGHFYRTSSSKKIANTGSN